MSIGAVQTFGFPSLLADSNLLPALDLTPEQSDKISESKFAQKDPNIRGLLEKMRGPQDRNAHARELVERLAVLEKKGAGFYFTCLRDIDLGFVWGAPWDPEKSKFWLPSSGKQGKELFIEIIPKRLAIGADLLFNFRKDERVFGLLYNRTQLIALVRAPEKREDALFTGRLSEGEPIFIMSSRFERGAAYPTRDVHGGSILSVVNYREAPKEDAILVVSEAQRLAKGDAFAIGNGYSMRLGLERLERAVVVSAPADLEIEAVSAEEMEVLKRRQASEKVVAKEARYWMKQSFSDLAFDQLALALEEALKLNFEEKQKELVAEVRKKLEDWGIQRESLPTMTMAAISSGETPLATVALWASQGFVLIDSHSNRHPYPVYAGGPVIGIGRKSEPDATHWLELPFDGVSRSHAVIKREIDGSFSITDLGSRNGTFVGAQRIEPNKPFRLNQSGVHVRFGPGVVMTFEFYAALVIPSGIETVPMEVFTPSDEEEALAILPWHMRFLRRIFK